MSQQHNRPIATGDVARAKRSTRPKPFAKLTTQSVLKFGAHKGLELSEVPMSYLEWLRDNGVFDEDATATRNLAHEFKKREKRGGRAIPVRELVSPLGNINFGAFENLNVGQLKQHQLQELLTVRHVQKASKERIRNRLRKLSQK